MAAVKVRHPETEERGNIEDEILLPEVAKLTVNTSNPNSLKHEDFHDESSAVSINASPIMQSPSKLNKKLKKPTNSNSQEDFKDLYHSVPPVRQHFKVLKQIGCGTFSNVYLAGIRKLGDKSPLFALKHIFSTSHPKRIENEIKCLKDIGGQQHVVGIESCIRHKGEVVIVMPYQKHDNFSDLLTKMSLDDVREYMRQLLMALHRVHTFNIIHRDVKPNNFLFDLETKKSGLVDFGLAQHVPVDHSKPPEQIKTETKPIAETTRKNSSVKNCNNVVEPTKPVHSNSVVDKRKTEISNSPRAKRRCLAEIQPNNIQTRTWKNTGVKKAFSEKKMSLDFGGKKIPRFGQSCNVENLTRKKLLQSPVIQDSMKFISPTTPLYLANRSATTGTKKRGSSSVTIADVFPSIRKYGSRLEKKPVGQRSSAAGDRNCNCYGKLSVCNRCLARPAPNAPRAGTAGFRPPEVLMRYSGQTTAVDIWAAGVIFLSLLSGRCPFFRPSDDVESLSQIVLILGSKRMQDVAKLCGKKLTCSQHFVGHDLRGVVIALRQSQQEEAGGPTLRSSPKRRKNPDQSPQKTTNRLEVSGGFRANDIPDSAFELLGRLLEPNPRIRITALKALYHDFLITDERKTYVSPRSKSNRKTFSS